MEKDMKKSKEKKPEDDYGIKKENKKIKKERKKRKEEKKKVDGRRKRKEIFQQNHQD